MSEKERAQNKSVPHLINQTFSQTLSCPGAKTEGSGDVCPELGKRTLELGGRVTSSTPRNPCFIIDFPKL